MGIDLLEKISTAVEKIEDPNARLKAYMDLLPYCVPKYKAVNWDDVAPAAKPEVNRETIMSLWRRANEAAKLGKL